MTEKVLNREAFTAGHLVRGGFLAPRTKRKRTCEYCRKEFEDAQRRTCGERKCWLAWKRDYQRRRKAKQKGNTHMTPDIREIPAADYFAAPGLSFSGMRDLAVSEYRYWYRRVNPDPPMEEESAEMVFGKALHTLVLEPSAFDSRYAREVVLEEIPGCLRTIDDMRQWLIDKGSKPKGTRKDDMIRQVHAIAPEWPILDVLKAQHEAANQGKVIMKTEDFSRVHGAASSLMDEPKFVELLKGARIEQSLFGQDPATGVLLKGRPDIMQPAYNADVKTFTQRRGKTIDQSVVDAIWYESYAHQAFIYAMLRGWPQWDGRHIVAFVESDPPHEVRLKAIAPKTAGQANLLWERARLDVRALIQKYAYCMKEFGTDRPWRHAQEVDPLLDEEIKALSYS